MVYVFSFQQNGLASSESVLSESKLLLKRVSFLLNLFERLNFCWGIALTIYLRAPQMTFVFLRFGSD
jgi:hypothetical protein